MVYKVEKEQLTGRELAIRLWQEYDKHGDDLEEITIENCIIKSEDQPDDGSHDLVEVNYPPVYTRYIGSTFMSSSPIALQSNTTIEGSTFTFTGA